MRACVVDVGSNSIKYTISDIAPHEIRAITGQRFALRLGTGVFENRVIPPDMAAAFIGIFRRIADQCQQYEVGSIRAVATSALREASNADSLISMVKAVTDIDIQIISGDEEADLVALAILRQLPDSASAVIIDIGGGSTEVISRSAHSPLAVVSLPLGAVRLAHLVGMPNNFKPLHAEQIHRHIDGVLHSSHLPPPVSGAHLYGVAGTFNALTTAARHLLPDQKNLSFKVLDTLIDLLINKEQSELIEHLGLNEERLQILLPGVLIARQIMRHYGAREVTYSNATLRDGLLLRLQARP